MFGTMKSLRLILLSFAIHVQANNHLVASAGLGALNRGQGQTKSPANATTTNDGAVQPIKLVGGVAFSILVQNGLVQNVTFDEYKSELVWAVDVLSLEVVSLMNRNWRRKTQEQEEQERLPTRNRQLAVSVDIPSSVTLLQLAGEGPCLPALNGVAGVTPQDRCEEVYASVPLSVDSTQNPVDVVTSFETLFNAAADVGRLESILNASFPDFFVRIVTIKNTTQTSTTNETSPPNATAEGSSAAAGSSSSSSSPPQTNPIMPSATKQVSPPEKTGLLLGGIIGIVAGAMAAFCMAGMSYVVAARRSRRATGLLFSVDKDDREIPHQETDLIENFSESGLEWADLESTNAENGDNKKQEKAVARNAEEDVDSKYSFEGVSLSEPSPQYRLPLSIRMPKSSPRSGMATGQSSPSKESSVGSASMTSAESTDPVLSGCRIIDFAGEIQDSRALLHATEFSVSLDNLERAIVEGDWETLAAAANTMASVASVSDHQAVTTKTTTILDSASQEWGQRDKNWQNTMDVTKAAELDRLIEDGNWAGIMEAAERYGREQA